MTFRSGHARCGDEPAAKRRLRYKSRFSDNGCAPGAGDRRRMRLLLMGHPRAEHPDALEAEPRPERPMLPHEHRSAVWFADAGGESARSSLHHETVRGALRADPPGPVAVVVKNSCPFGSVPKNVCWSTVIAVVVEPACRAEILYGERWTCPSRPARLPACSR